MPQNRTDYVSLIYDAFSNFYVVEKCLEDISYIQTRAIIGYNLQQAIEKCLKALIEYHAAQYGTERYPFIHDIGELIDIVASLGINVPNELPDLSDDLTRWEADTRYLCLGEDLVEAEYVRYAYNVAFNFFLETETYCNVSATLY